MKILIVENDAAVTRIWTHWFSKTHEVRSAFNVDQAKAQIDQEMPELVFLDLRLNGPDASGLEVYSYLREYLNADVPIVFITGLEYNVDLYKKAETLASADTDRTVLLKKPVSISEMAEAIKCAAA
jgi:DNA-binding response OmpR family regulator